MKRKILLLPLLLVFIAGCAMFGAQQSGQKAFADMNSIEKATYFQEMYNKQYDDTKSMGEQPTLTPAQKKIYDTKRQLLTKAWPLIRLYRNVVINGGIPSPGTEQQINDIINQLIAAGL